jgi:tetratricopeptide (TPR) repeat protein
LKIILISLLVFSFMARTGAVAQTRGTEWETLNDEVKSMYRQGQYGRAEVLAKKALQTAEQTLGLDHPGVAASLNNLAALYFTQGQYAQAEPLYKRSLAISEKAIGPNHSDVATVLENMAILYRKTDRVKTADEFEKRAASIRNISIKIKQEEDGKYLPEDNIPDPYSMTVPAPITKALTTDQVSISAPAVDKTVAKPAILIGDSYTFEVQNPLTLSSIMS